MNSLFSKALYVITFISSALVFSIFLILAYLCFDLFSLNDFSNFFSFTWNVQEEKYGILLALFGSFFISFIAVVLAFIFSFSLSSLIYLNEQNIISIFLEKTILLMAAVPTVIYAFAALFTFFPFISSNIKEGASLSILLASLVLSLILIPTMSLIFLNTFRLKKRRFEKTCLTLALSHDEFFFKFILRNSSSEILSGIILSSARALGDTMIVLMLAGNALAFPESLFDSGRSLSSHIALIFANDYESMAFKAIFLCAFLLLCSNFFLLLSIKYIKRRIIIV